MSNDHLIDATLEALSGEDFKAAERAVDELIGNTVNWDFDIVQNLNSLTTTGNVVTVDHKRYISTKPNDPEFDKILGELSDDKPINSYTSVENERLAPLKESSIAHQITEEPVKVEIVTVEETKDILPAQPDQEIKKQDSIIIKQVIAAPVPEEKKAEPKVLTKKEQKEADKLNKQKIKEAKKQEKEKAKKKKVEAKKTKKSK